MSDDTEHDRIDAEIVRVTRSSDPFAAAVRATRMPMLITDPNQVDNPIVFANDAFIRLTGYTREEVLGRNCRFLQGPETNPDDVTRLREAIDRRSQIEMEIINHRKDDPPPLNWSTLKYVFWQTGGSRCRRSAISPKRSSRSYARSMCWSRRGNPLPTRSARSA